MFCELSKDHCFAYDEMKDNNTSVCILCAYSTDENKKVTPHQIVELNDNNPSNPPISSSISSSSSPWSETFLSGISSSLATSEAAARRSLTSSVNDLNADALEADAAPAVAQKRRCRAAPPANRGGGAPYFTTKIKNPSHVTDFIRESCYKLHLDSDGLVRMMIHDYFEFCQKMRSLSRRCYTMETRVSVVLYESLKRLLSPRSMKEIGYVTGASMKATWKLQRLMTPIIRTTALTIRPQDLIMSKLGFLNLQFKDYKIMERALLKHHDKFGDFSPATIAATFLHHYMKLRTPPKITNVSRQELSTMLSTTTMSVHRYTAFIKKNYDLNLLFQ